MTAVRASGTDVPSYTETWDCAPESAAKARRLVAAALSLWGIAEQAEAGVLVASELVANAITHSSCRRFRIRVSRPGNRTVKIIVSDTSRKIPSPSEAGPDSESGRGLHLVALMSTKWGYELKGWGKIVWAELELPEQSDSGVES
ncbi:ATP-binding protein [Streptomyces sp. NPDC057253]|uniref:ATP-binding protein n=1 Tax=Streptomyces sp. NPDC057253 TaxID=3346069 RepID=UPI0036396C0B